MARDTDFAKEVLAPQADQLLEASIEFIKRAYEPNEVFDDDELKSCVQKEFNPEDVFTANELSQWAEENGYIKIDKAKDY